ncbi:NAD(P)-dependent oxidoreductase [Terracoccus sp. 273MFTsu3.1]|uniref:NAD(P)-dependent oxidoreductase n=1 Tax=Terracoccus sp. 273MFTsu3.1 TaxID=1172188 RepID=UPI00036997CC|nr:NAD(P)-dependent oxidoreductase [Terracoccus sp. 273MFTsu3.1]
MAEVALLGTGRMGAAMALRLAGAGHHVRVWNRTTASARALVDSSGDGLVLAETAEDAVTGVDAVLTVLADGGVTRSVLLADAVQRGLTPGTLVIDLGTSGTDAAATLGRHLREAGHRFVDAPVSGSVPAVVAGTLLVMASGTPEDVAAARVVLKAFAAEVLRVGDVGAGQAMKLAVNLVVHDLNAALAEALDLAERSGVPRAEAYDVLERSVVAAPFVRYKRSAFLDPETPTAMSLALVAKDLGLITAQGRTTGAALPLTEQALARVQAAVDAGWGPRDMADLSRFHAPAAAHSPTQPETRG